MIRRLSVNPGGDVWINTDFVAEVKPGWACDGTPVTDVVMVIGNGFARHSVWGRTVEAVVAYLNTGEWPK